jgi:small-conductance mechanosensitive channel
MTNALPASRFLFTLLAAVLLAVVAAWPLQAQDAAEDRSDLSAEVIVDGRQLFEVSGVSGLLAPTRARTIAGNIVTVARSSADMTVSMTVNEDEFGHRILANGREIMVVTGVDAEREGISDTSILAFVYSRRIEEAILDWRRSRSDAAVERGLINGLAWTAAFAVFFAFLFWLNRRVPVWTDRILSRYLAAVEQATQEIVRTRAVAEVLAVAVKGLLAILFFVALYYYVSVVLFSFAQTRPIATVLLNYVTDPIRNALHAILGFIPSLVVLILIFFMTRYLVRLARVTFENIDAGTVRLKGFQKHWVWPTYNLLRAFLIVSAVVLAYPYIPGSDSAAFQGMSILLGIMVSIGSNSVVANVLAGLFVIYRQSTSVGDIIRIGDYVGEVSSIKLTETHLRSYKNEMISIPNAQLLNSEVVNYSQRIDDRGLIVHTTVGIGYDEHHRKIEALLIEAAGRTGGVKKSPPPFVLRTELGDFAVTYEINAHAGRNAHIPRLLSDLRANVLDALHDAGVQIMSPHYEGDPNSLKIPAVPESAEVPAPKVAPIA